MENIRPDIWVRAGDERYFVEIAVTHFVDEVKALKMREMQIPAFEVDLQSLKSTFTFAALEELLFSAPYTAKWIFNKHVEAMEEEASLIHALEKQRLNDRYALAQVTNENARKQKESRNLGKNKSDQRNFITTE